MSEIVFLRNELLLNNLVKNLEKRNFNAFYCATKEDAINRIITMTDKNDVISWGGSISIDELKIKEYLENNGYKTINREKARTKEERAQMVLNSLSSDVFLMSANAISEDGILVNIDGTGNRVAALCYGPKKIIVVAGVNKITKNVEEAISRARNYAAPINANRVSKFMDIETPCLKTGSCMNCKSTSSICSQIVLTRLSNPKGRISIILVNDIIGY